MTSSLPRINAWLLYLYDFTTEVVYSYIVFLKQIFYNYYGKKVFDVADGGSPGPKGECMRTKLAVILVMLTLCCAALSSCLVNNGQLPGGTNGNENYYIICNDSAEAKPVRDAFYETYGKMCSVYDDTETPDGRMIVIGDNANPSSVYAEELARRTLSATSYDDPAGYIICEHEGNIAVWWSDEVYKDAAINALVTDYVKKENLALESGYKSTVVDSLYAYRRSLEQAEMDGYFVAVAEGLGQETSDALRALYDIYDERLYEWMANLYDPGTGGYYYSNSALANAGFLPDLESTKQCLSFLMDTGMLNSYGGSLYSLQEVFPEEMQESIISFVHSLQSSYDGYYYHPQWPTVTESRSRDVNWATQLLDIFGEKPLYTTPTGVEGSLGAPGAYATGMTGRLTAGSAVVAASCVVAVSSYTSKYESPEAFKEYFDSLPWGTDSYTAGGQLSGISREIRNAGLGEYCVELMDAEQEKIQQQRIEDGLEPNGLWEYEVSYRAVNGIMKISSTYTVLGGKINYAQQMIEAAIEMLLAGKDVNGKTVENGVYVYNPWVAINYCLSNLEEFASEEEMLKYRAIIRENAVELLNSTVRDVRRFRMDDGSFSIVTLDASDSTKRGSKYKLYGLLHSVEGSIEGDVNGTSVIANGLIREVCSALYVREFTGKSTIPLYYQTDFERYMEIISGLSEIVKPPIELKSEYDFEDELLGTTNTDIMSLSNVQIFSTGAVTIANDPLGDNGNVLRFVKKPYTEKGDKFAVAANQSVNSYCYVLEWDMLVDEVTPAAGKTSSVILQIKLDDAYCLVVEWNNGKLRLSDMDNNVNVFTGITTTMDEWHTIRLEYYPSDYDAYTKIYIDGEYEGASNNFSGKAVGSKPSINYRSVEFFALRAADFDIYFDNIIIEKNAQDPNVEEEKPEFLPRVEFDFEDEVLGATNSDILCLSNANMKGGQLTVTEDEDNDYCQVMKYYTAATDVGGDYVYFRTPSSSNDDCYALEWDMKVEDVVLAEGKTSSTMLQIKLSDCYWFVLIYEGGELHLADVSGSAATPVRMVDSDGDAITVPLNEWHKFRVEYYAETGEILIFLDDMDEAVYTSSNFVGSEAEGAVPANEYNTVCFYALKASSFTAYFDNVVTEKLATDAE